jgi:type IV pilus assembly protein PilW
MSIIAKDNHGFTLIELLVSMAIFGFILAAAGTMFSSQQKVYTSQQQAVDLEQSMRAGLSFIEREIRMAGYDEYPKKPAGANFITAGPSLMNFTMSIHNGVDDDSDGSIDEWDETGNSAFDGIDDDGDGETDGYGESAAVGNADTADVNEDITYGFDPANDANGDGIADSPGGAPLGRINVNGGASVDLIDNVEAVSFAYAFDNDNNNWIDFDDGNNDGVQDAGESTIWAVDTNADGFLDTSLDTNSDGVIDINDAAGGTALLSTVDIESIRSIQIWILARVPFEDKDYVDNNTYVMGDKRIVRNDGFRRRILNTTIRCRNAFTKFQ